MHPDDDLAQVGLSPGTPRYTEEARATMQDVLHLGGSLCVGMRRGKKRACARVLPYNAKLIFIIIQVFSAFLSALIRHSL